MDAYRMEKEAEVQEGMRRLASDVEGIRLCLFTLRDTLPRPAYEEQLEEAETDLATELRATIERVVQDSIEPAIRDLRKAAESKTPAKQGQSTESAARPGVTAMRAFDEKWADSIPGDGGLHPRREGLERFMRGELGRVEARAVVRHLLRGCPQCRQKTRQLWQLGELARYEKYSLEETRRVAAGAPGEPGVR